MPRCTSALTSQKRIWASPGYARGPGRIGGPQPQHLVVGPATPCIVERVPANVGSKLIKRNPVREVHDKVAGDLARGGLGGEFDRLGVGSDIVRAEPEE